MQQLIQQQQMAQAQQQNTSAAAATNNATAYANEPAQTRALFFIPQLANQYSQLSPELQQILSVNREQLVAMIEKLAK